MLRRAIVVESGDGASPVSTGGRCLRLPLAVRVRRVMGLSELIAFAIHNKNHANRHERGRDDKDQNPTAQGLNHSSTGGGRLRIAERAALGEGWERGGEYDQSNQCNTNKQERSLDPNFSS